MRDGLGTLRRSEAVVIPSERSESRDLHLGRCDCLSNDGTRITARIFRKRPDHSRAGGAISPPDHQRFEVVDGEEGCGGTSSSTGNAVLLPSAVLCALCVKRSSDLPVRYADVARRLACSPAATTPITQPTVISAIPAYDM